MAHSRSQAPSAPSYSPRRRATIATLVLLLLAALGVTGFVVAGAPVEEFTVDIGPIALPAGADHHAVVQPTPRAILIPVDGWYRGFSVEMVDERGRPVSKRLLHHANLIAPERRELFSPIMLRLGAAGPETKPVKLPGVLGYRFRRGDSLLVTAMLHNPTTTAHREATVRIHLLYTPADSWFRPLGVYPFYVDVMPPAGIHAYDLPPGRSERSWEGRPAAAGRIVGVGGHLHKYSVALRFQDVTAGRTIWEATPTTDAEGNVTHMPRKFFLPFGVRIEPEHVYRLTAVYDNPTGDTLRGGGMGAFGGAIVPDADSAWPKVVRDNPVYRYDVKVTHGGHRPRGHARHRPGHTGGAGEAHAH